MVPEPNGGSLKKGFAQADGRGRQSVWRRKGSFTNKPNLSGLSVEQMISNLTVSDVLAFMPPFLKAFWEKLCGSPLGYRLARGAVWSFVGAVVSRGCGLLSSILVARMLGKTGFGELGILQSSVGLFATFAGFGLGLTSTKYVAEFRLKDPARAGRVIGVSSIVSWLAGGIMTAILFVIAPWLARHSLAAPQLDEPLRVSSLLVLLGAVSGAQTGALAGFEAFRKIAQVNLLSGVFTLGLTLAGALWLGLKGVVWGLVAGQAITCWLGFWAVRKQAGSAGVRLVLQVSKRDLAVLWRFSLPALAVNTLVGPVYWICNTMLVKSSGGYAEMGLFNAANQWFGALLFLPGILGQAALPVLSERLGQNDLRQAKKVLGFYLKLNLLVVSPFILLGCIVSPLIMASYGPGFQQAWPVLCIVLITAGLFALQTPVGQILVAGGRMWLGASMNLGWALSCLLLCSALARYGAFWRIYSMACGLQLLPFTFSQHQKLAQRLRHVAPVRNA